MLVTLHHLFVDWLLAHGPIILFLTLALGILVLPFPDDTFLLLAGFLVAQGKLDLSATLWSAILGSITGITVSFFLGRFSSGWLLKNVAPKIQLTEERLKKARRWFHRVGKWALLICYFVPFMRHIAGFLAGGSSLKVNQFALYAYTGALLWVLSYLFLGYFLHRCPLLLMN